MVTFFACPKPFQGHTAVIQHNAIESWTRLRPKPEIILMGAEQGVAGICQELGLIHIAEIERNEYGTPLINSIFQIGQAHASQPVVCYINADILLTSDFISVVETIAARMSQFLIVGQRWDVEIKEVWRFNSAEWETDLRHLVERNGKLHPPSGIDFFCFPRGMYGDIPPFAIGRLAWDNWLVWRARSNNVPIVDITAATIVVHQNHEYHASTLRKLGALEVHGMKSESSNSHRMKFDGHLVELGPEAQRNSALVPVEQNLNIWAATWMIDREGELRRRRLTLTPSYLYYQLKWVLPLYWPAFGRFFRWLLSIRVALLSGRNLKRRNYHIN